MPSTIVIRPVTRIEGHACIEVQLEPDGKVAGAHVLVQEIRGFEKFLEGTELFKMPQITARICGVCPAAHHLASVMAIENGLGLVIPPEAVRLRRLLYAGHILHSHALSTFVMSGPDLLAGLDAAPGERSIFRQIQLEPDFWRQILRLRTIGQLTVEMIGGRGVHPVTAIPGGMSAHPGPEKLDRLARWGQEALGLLEPLAVRFQQQLERLAEFRQATRLPVCSLALSLDGQVDFLQGELVAGDSNGQILERHQPAGYADALLETVEPASYMKAIRLRSRPEIPLAGGPLARLNVNRTISTPRAMSLLAAYQQAGWPRLSALDFVEARIIEMVHAAELLAELAASPAASPELRVPAAPRPGRYISLIEAPRGILVHDYTADEAGRVRAVNLVVATQANYLAMDAAVAGAASLLLPLGDENALLNGLEFAVRCFDPCLACATHVTGRMPLTVHIRQEGHPLRIPVREVCHD